MPTSIEFDVLAPRFLEVSVTRLHGLACELVEGRRTDVKHHAQDKPWTVWPLREIPAPGPVGSATLRLRLNWLPDDPPPARLTYGLPQAVRIGKYQCRVLQKKYQLSEFERLAAGPVTGSARLVFHRPTYFRHKRMDVVDPTAELLLRSVIRRWNRYCPPDMAVPESEIRRMVDSAVLTVVDGAYEAVLERGRSKRWASLERPRWKPPRDYRPSPRL